MKSPYIATIVIVIIAIIICLFYFNRKPEVIAPIPTDVSEDRTSSYPELMEGSVFKGA